jgi:hypothetical protein
LAPGRKRGKPPTERSPGSGRPPRRSDPLEPSLSRDTRRAGGQGATDRFALIARAYDSGAAIRFQLLEAPTSSLTLTGEATEFCLPKDALVYSSRDEGTYQRSPQTKVAPIPHPPLTPSCDIGDLADTPITATLPDGTAMLITESDRLHYPRLMLRSTARGLETRLMRYPGRATGYSGPGDTQPEDRFDVPSTFATPWRLIVIAPSVAGLIERQDLVPTLATPNRLGDVRWVKPGRLMRIRNYTTQAGLDTVDFAAQRKLDYVLWDAHWYGDGTDPSDATRPIPAIDIQRVIQHARAKGIGMILYVDRVPAMRQLDAIVETYQRWGVAGIKFGFVWEGRQSDVDFLYRLVETCGRHRLFVNLHDNLRPAGLERTLPNYLTLEGVRGNENFLPPHTTARWRSPGRCQVQSTIRSATPIRRTGPRMPIRWRLPRCISVLSQASTGTIPPTNTPDGNGPNWHSSTNARRSGLKRSQSVAQSANSRPLRVARRTAGGSLVQLPTRRPVR